MDAKDSFLIDPVDLNHVLGEDGKIYGYKDLKIHIWLNVISFRAYADITYQSTYGFKHTTDLKPVLQKIFGESLVEQKADFLQTFSTESDYIRTVVSNGEIVKTFEGYDNAFDDHLEEKASSTIEVIRMDIRSMPVGELYSRLVPLVLLLIEGGSPIDITDPRWEICFIIERISDGSGENVKLVGFTSFYRFYRYPDSSRLRISQILVLPPHHGKGYGRHLLEALNSIAISEDVYDVTVEEPSEYLQHVRACIDTLRLVTFEPIKPAITSVVSQLKQGNLLKKTCEFPSDPPAKIIEDVRKMLKINRKQFLRCWEVLIYMVLNADDSQCLDNYKTWILVRLKVDILGKDVGATGRNVIKVPNNFDTDASFVMFRSQSAGKDYSLEADDVDGNHKSQEELFRELVDGRMEEIKVVAEKVSLYSKS